MKYNQFGIVAFEMLSKRNVIHFGVPRDQDTYEIFIQYESTVWVLSMLSSGQHQGRACWTEMNVIRSDFFERACWPYKYF